MFINFYTAHGRVSFGPAREIWDNESRLDMYLEGEDGKSVTIAVRAHDGKWIVQSKHGLAMSSYMSVSVVEPKST